MGLTRKQWYERVAAWHSFRLRHKIANNSRRGSARRRLFRELRDKDCLVPDDNPPEETNYQWWIIKPGITRMPAFVDPAHAWQTRAWQAMRWHKNGVTARALCAVLGRRTVTLRQMRTWLHLLATRGVVRKTRATGLVGSRFVFTIVGPWKDSPQPPHRYIAINANIHTCYEPAQ